MVVIGGEVSTSSQAPRPEPLSLPERLVLLEADAYDEFSRWFGPRLKRFFERRGLSPMDAEDLAATCVTDIALKARMYRPELGTFNAWVFAVAGNALKDFVKKSRRVAQTLRELPAEVVG